MNLAESQTKHQLYRKKISYITLRFKQLSNHVSDEPLTSNYGNFAISKKPWANNKQKRVCSYVHFIIHFKCMFEARLGKNGYVNNNGYVNLHHQFYVIKTKCNLQRENTKLQWIKHS